MVVQVDVNRENAIVIVRRLVSEDIQIVPFALLEAHWVHIEHSLDPLGHGGEASLADLCL